MGISKPVAYPTGELDRTGLASARSARAESHHVKAGHVMAALGVITLLGAILRFSFLSQSIWYDEAITVMDISGNWHHLVSAVANVEANPPMPFVLLWLWHQVVGTHAASLRLLPALAGTLTIPASFAAAREIVGRRTAIATAALIATNPMLVYYSIELRSYALEVLLCTVGLAAFLRVVRTSEVRPLVVWSVSSILAVASHYFAVLIIAPQAGWLLWSNRRAIHRLRTTAATLLVACGSAVWLPLAIYQNSHTARFDRAQASSPFGLVTTEVQKKLTAVSGASHAVKEVLVGPGFPLKTLATPLLLLVFLLALGVIWRLRQNDETRSVIFLLLLAALSLLGAPILVLAHNFYLRYILPLFIPLLLAIAFGSMHLGRRFGPLVVATLCAGWALISVAVATIPEYSPRDDLKGVSHALGRAEADRIIAVDATLGEVFPLKLYRPNAVVPTQHVAFVSQLDVVALPLRGRAADDGAPRPPAPRLQALPAGLRLVDTIFGPNYVVERYIASRPVKLALDPQSGVFTSVWRFLLEKRGAGGSQL